MTSTHERLQFWSGAGQPAVHPILGAHTCEPEQTVVQLPQWFGSFETSAQRPSQFARAPQAIVHLPSTQAASPCDGGGHWLPHAPQLSTSLLVSTHAPEHSFGYLVSVQAMPQWPLSHVALPPPAGGGQQVLPHLTKPVSQPLGCSTQVWVAVSHTYGGTQAPVGVQALPAPSGSRSDAQPQASASRAPIVAAKNFWAHVLVDDMLRTAPA